MQNNPINFWWGALVNELGHQKVDVAEHAKGGTEEDEADVASVGILLGIIHADLVDIPDSFSVHANACEGESNGYNRESEHNNAYKSAFVHE